MIGTRGIGKDALARMECVSACGCRRLIGSTARSRLEFVGGCTDEWKIFNGPRPGKLGIVEGVIALGPLNVWERHDHESDVPEGGRKDGATWDAALDPGVLEETCREQAFGDTGAAKKFGEIAGDALMELSPADVELWFDGAVQFDGGFGSRPQLQKVERIVGFVRGHERLCISRL
jgi:hypothetical protein